MTVLKNMKLGTKILTGFAAVLLLMFIAILFGYFAFNRTNRDFEQYHMIAQHSNMASEIQAALLDGRLQFKTYLATGDQAYKAAYIRSFTKMTYTIYEMKKGMQYTLWEEQILQLAELSETYQNRVERVVEYNREKDNIETERMIPAGTRMLKNLSKIMETAFLDGDEDAAYGAGKAQEHMLTVRLHANKYLNTRKQSDRKEVQEQFGQMAEWLLYLEVELQDPKRIELLQQVKEDQLIYEREFLNMVTILQERDRLVTQMDSEIGPKISKTAEQINQQVLWEQNAFGPKVREDNQRTLSRMTVIAWIAFGLSVWIALWIRSVVMYPVQAITDTFNSIVDGAVNLNIRLKNAGKDEMGQLANGFNVFMDKFQNMLQEKERQSWLRTSQADLNDQIRGEEDLQNLYGKVITYIAKLLDCQIGGIYSVEEGHQLLLSNTYGYQKDKGANIRLEDGMVGQSVLEQKPIMITDVPADYIAVRSGIGQAVPKNIVIFPFCYNGEVKAVAELGTFHPLQDLYLDFLELIGEGVAVTIHSAQIRNKMKTLLEKTIEQAEELQTQQEELRSANEELEERTRFLERQKLEIHMKNDKLQKANKEVERKAHELERANHYKSEFLANVSHELRTPLNSILVLSQLLAEKKSMEPLTEKQLEFAKTIHSSGADLLSLINDILDLSKVEAGKMEISMENVSVIDLKDQIESSFRQIANGKQLVFQIDIEDRVPRRIRTDAQRIMQILRNLLSNAFKFTEAGSIEVRFAYPEKETVFRNEHLHVENTIGVYVQDTGIGIPKSKQDIIFEAFQQADGTTSRKYGGTGLGLSISRELAKLLGGEIQLQSQEGVGSTFVLYLPSDLESPVEPTAKQAVEDEPYSGLQQYKDKNEKMILIIEDNPDFSKVLATLAEEKGFEAARAQTGEEGIKLAKEKGPNAILLDISLPGIDGWEVVKRLKSVPETQSIPIHIISAVEENIKAKEGIIGYLKKPVSVDLLEETFCKLDNFVESDSKTAEENSSVERLMGETMLFLHSLNGQIGQENPVRAEISKDKELSLSGKKVLIVDDDMRNVFALTNVLEEKKMEVIVGRTGKEGFEKLIEQTDIDIVIMDIMMPELDGYETMRKIRAHKEFKNLPIIALTAKAMKDDRKKCIDAGASDYFVKPVETDRLLSLLKVWLYQ